MTTLPHKVITTFKRILKIGLVAASVSLLCSASQATLLSSAYEAQLENWLGTGDQSFTNIYTYDSGDSASDFHSVADGMGATFTLLKVVMNAVEYVVGGYNPQSWGSFYGYNNTSADADRTAFLFNLTDVVKRTQNLTTDSGGANGHQQTANDPNYGPAFGGGFDLSTGDDLNPSFGISGYANAFSYGQGSNVFGNSYNYFTISELEVYTVTTTVPDASSNFGLFGLVLLGLVGVRFRMKRV